MVLPSGEIRQQFIDFFCQKHGHQNVPSSPVVPLGDDTLLFANAGMNQFKPYFLGTERPKFTRVANTQKCIRAGGKHNDLDDVGKDSYHHTFFEMLGNWSFGDYFKPEAISWAWELLTQVWKLDPARLHVTVFEGDEKNGIPEDAEAADIWRSVGVLPGHVHLGNKEDNFWEMGSTGPCGPCTEVHYDHTPDLSGGPLVNAGTDQVIEIWNLVFIQFNRNADQSLTPLPARHVDTGMGFERITKVLQGKSSNYDTDIFTPLIDATAKLTGKVYDGSLADPTDIGFRVIADHARMATFAITDGARPGAKKRDAVLRSVVRRAVRYGYMQFDRREPFLFELVPVIVGQMGGAFPELKRNPAEVSDIIRREERDFFRTVAGGIKRFEKAVAGISGTRFDGDTAADLLTTYGFPLDMTTQMAAERGLTVSETEVEAAIERHKKESGKGYEAVVLSAVKGDLPPTDDAAKFGPGTLPATLQGWLKGNEVVAAGALEAGETVALLLDRTPFYAEQGGQVGDTGFVRTTAGAEFEVTGTKRLGDAVLHVGTLVSGELRAGEAVSVERDEARRREVVRNHTATHLLNLALRRVLGDHVEQRGSLVDGEKTRFDFSHDKPVSADELRRVEAEVNDAVGRDLAVSAAVMPLAEAKQIPGVRAVFGEKYPDPVRVVLIGPETPALATEADSVEFCGGTHVGRTGDIGVFKFASQEGVAKGIRRVTAVTGQAARDTLARFSGTVEQLAAQLQCPPEEVATRVQALQDELKRTQTQLGKLQAANLVAALDQLVAAAPDVNGTKVVAGQLEGATAESVRGQIPRLKQKHKSAYVVLGWVEDGAKPMVLVALTPDLVAKGLKAGDIVKPLAARLGGSGGGKPDLAQAGGKDAAQLAAALEDARVAAVAAVA